MSDKCTRNIQLATVKDSSVPMKELHCELLLLWRDTEVGGYVLQVEISGENIQPYTFVTELSSSVIV